MKQNWKYVNVLVTGGGSGIGKEISRQLLNKGATVIVATLLETEIEQLGKELGNLRGKLITIQIDLTSHAAIDKLLQQLHDWNLNIDVLINNAGTALFGNHIDLDIQRVNTMLNLNIVAVTELCSKVAQHMIQRQISGSILNIASIGGFTPVPKLAAYAASKHYVVAFTQALHEELAPHHIFVGAFCPGITRTPIFEAMGLEQNNQSKSSVSYISQKFSMDVKDVAFSAIESLEKKVIVSLPGLNKVMPILGLLPDRFLAWFMYRAVAGRSAK
ncbi:SDR family NAD(P)-dependent oxidoreductase [Acinetobacter junii]|uniref:SDR family NAD(P)-dependent oxidoreductase n=1 Tax=Acinetobacter junii TaxID=40215 RepID=UPI001F3FACC3|nr:SDR family NAD(P)-dependent oxidoreductase [Acinetobacter junii]